MADLNTDDALKQQMREQGIPPGLQALILNLRAFNKQYEHDLLTKEGDGGGQVKLPEYAARLATLLQQAQIESQNLGIKTAGLELIAKSISSIPTAVLQKLQADIGTTSLVHMQEQIREAEKVRETARYKDLAARQASGDTTLTGADLAYLATGEIPSAKLKEVLALETAGFQRVISQLKSVTEAAQYDEMKRKLNIGPIAGQLDIDKAMREAEAYYTSDDPAAPNFRGKSPLHGIPLELRERFSKQYEQDYRNFVLGLDLGAILKDRRNGLAGLSGPDLAQKLAELQNGGSIVGPDGTQYRMTKTLSDALTDQVTKQLGMIRGAADTFSSQLAARWAPYNTLVKAVTDGNAAAISTVFVNYFAGGAGAIKGHVAALLRGGGPDISMLKSQAQIASTLMERAGKVVPEGDPTPPKMSGPLIT